MYIDEPRELLIPSPNTQAKSAREIMRTRQRMMMMMIRAATARSRWLPSLNGLSFRGGVNEDFSSHKSIILVGSYMIYHVINPRSKSQASSYPSSTST